MKKEKKEKKKIKKNVSVIVKPQKLYNNEHK